MRSLLRWLSRLALGAVLVVALVIGFALITAHTEWGREQLRERVEAALDEVFPGGVRVGRIDGSVLGSLTVHDIELIGQGGTLRLAGGRVRGEIALWPLVTGTVRVDQVVADGVTVRVVVGRGRPEPPAVVAPPSAWRAELPRIVVHDARVEIAGGGAIQRLDELDARGSVTVGPAGVAIAGWVHGRWHDRAAELTVSGAFEVGERVRVPGALITLGGAAAVVSGAVIDVDRPGGAAVVRAPASALVALWPEIDGVVDADRLGEVRAVIGVAGTTPRLEIDATASGAQLWASLAVHDGLRGVVSARSAELAAVTGGWLAGEAAVVAALDGDRRGLRATVIASCRASEAAPASARLRCGTPALPVTGATVAVDASFGDTDSVRATAVASGPGGVQLVGSAAGHRRASAIVLDEATLTADAAVLDVAGVPVAGALRATARASGPLAPGVAIEVTGELGGDVRISDEIDLAGIAGTFVVRAAPSARLELGRLAVAAVRRGRSRLGRAELEITGRRDGYGFAVTAWPPVTGLVATIDGLVTVSADRTSARLARARVTLPDGTSWAGGGGSLAITGRAIALDGLVLGRGDARLALAGELVRASGAVALRAEAERLAAAQILPGARGDGRARLVLGRRGGAWHADGRIEVTGLAASADAAPVDASAHLVLAGSRVLGTVAATGTRLGGVELAVAVDAPGDLFDLAAWRARDAAAIRSAVITARQVRLAGVAELAPLAGLVVADRLTPSGTLDGRLDLAPGGAGGELVARGFELGFGTLEADLALAAETGAFAVTSRARLAGVATGVLTTRLAVPARPFDPATWRRGGRDLVTAVVLDVDELAFDPALLGQLGVTWRGGGLPLRGRASARLALDAALHHAELTATLRGVTGGPLVEPVTQRVTVTAGPAGTRVHAELAADARAVKLGVIDGELAMTVERWLADPARVIRAPLTARWTLARTPAPAVLGLLGRRDLTAGTLEGSAAIHGALAAPLVERAQVIARDVEVAPRLGAGKPPAITAEATARWDGASASLELTGRAATGGTLRASASGRPDQPGALTGALAATRFDLAPLAALVPDPRVPTAGVIDADLALRAGVFSGSLHLAGGALPLAASIGTLRDVTADVTVGRSVTGALSGALGRGTVRATIEAATDLSTIDVRDLVLRDVTVLGALRPTISADASAALRRDGSRLRGTATVTRAEIALIGQAVTPLLDPTVPPDLVLPGAAAAPVSPGSPGSAGAPGSPGPAFVPGARPPGRSWLDLDVALGPTRIDARNVVDSVGLDVAAVVRSPRLAVSLGDTVGLTGRVAIDGTHVDVLGRRYTLGPGELEFVGTLDPRLDVRLHHEFSSLSLRVALVGSASRPELQLSSDPGGYTRDQLTGFLLGGEPGGDSTTQPGEAVRGALALGLSSRLGRQLTSVLPIRLEALACELATTATSASCSVRRRLTPRTFLGYRHRLDPLPDENANELQLQYRLGNTSLELTGGDREHISAEILWRWRP